MCPFDVRLALICLIALTGVAAAAPTVPAITAQDLRDVADGSQAVEDLVLQISLQDRIAMIHKLIRAGGSCKPIDTACVVHAEYEPPKVKDTWKSPCFRRWNLYVLLNLFPGDETIHLDAKEMSV